MLKNYNFTNSHKNIISNCYTTNELKEKTIVYNILLRARRNYIGSIIFSSLLIIAILLLIIGYLEVIVVKINKDLLNELRWYDKYIIANSDDGNSLYTSFYSYLVAWCATGSAIIFFMFSLMFKIVSHKSIIEVKTKYKNYENIIASNKLIIMSYFFVIVVDSVILASINHLINRIYNNELL